MDENEVFYCYGKKDFCDVPYLCIDCIHFDHSGGKYQVKEEEDSEN